MEIPEWFKILFDGVGTLVILFILFMFEKLIFYILKNKDKDKDTYTYYYSDDKNSITIQTKGDLYISDKKIKNCNYSSKNVY